MEITDYWVILKFSHKNEIYYKVFATFVGGYLDEDRWKMNSGIVSVEENDDSYLFKGLSGSIYKCDKNSYRTISYTQQVLEHILANAYKVDAKVELMDENTDWTQIEYNL